MSLPTEFLAYTRSRIALGNNGNETTVVPEWAKRQGTLGEQPASICGWAWETPSLGWFRVSLLDAGQSAQVFSALALPRSDYNLPLFGAELVMISGAVTVLALDWMPLFPGSPHLDALEPIRRQFGHFPPGGELPKWAAEAFSPFALFSRPRGAVADSEILGAFQAYLDGYLVLALTALPRGIPSETAAAQQHYCNAHFENDPGSTMLSKIFGSNWAERYAREFLFRTVN